MAIFLRTERAAADEPCAVHAHNAGDDRGKWSQAVRAVGEALDDASSVSDCRSIDVTVDGDGAWVRVSTRDGRTAVRRIATPTELRPLVDALFVTVPESVPAAAPLDQAESNDSLPSPPDPPPSNADVVRPKERESGRLRLSLETGLKGPLGSDVFAVGQIAATAAFGRWELGIRGRWEAEHDIETVRDAASHASVSAIGGGPVIGRREPLGQLAIVYGTSAAVFATGEELAKHALGEPKQRDGAVVAEPRLGAYVGVVLPPISRFRLRAQIEAERTLSSATPAGPDFPRIPRWGFGLVVGAETALLP